MSWHYETTGWRLVGLTEHDGFFLDYEFALEEKAEALYAAGEILRKQPHELIALEDEGIHAAGGYVRRDALTAVRVKAIRERVDDPKKRWWQ